MLPTGASVVVQGGLVVGLGLGDHVDDVLQLLGDGLLLLLRRELGPGGHLHLEPGLHL